MASIVFSCNLILGMAISEVDGNTVSSTLICKSSNGRARTQHPEPLS